MSPDVFLSQNRIRTENYGGFNGTPAEKVAALQYLNGLRTWNPATEDFEYTTYRTPGFSAGTLNVPSNQTIMSQNAAVRAYLAAVKTGDLDKVHEAVDVINAVHQITGLGEFIPMSDWDIVSETNLTAQFINSERVSVATTGMGTFVGSPLPWFDTKEAFHALNAYTAS